MVNSSDCASPQCNTACPNGTTHRAGLVNGKKRTAQEDSCRIRASSYRLAPVFVLGLHWGDPELPQRVGLGRRLRPGAVPQRRLFRRLLLVAMGDKKTPATRSPKEVTLQSRIGNQSDQPIFTQNNRGAHAMARG